MENVYMQLIEQLESNKKAVLITTLRSDASGKGSIEKKLLPANDPINSDFKLEEADKRIQHALQSGCSEYIEEGNNAYLIEPFYPETRLIILGGGHIAKPLVEFAAKTGFSVTVADDRAEFANRERFPEAAKVICESFNTCIGNLHVSETDYVVIITRGHRYDTDCLRHLVNKKTAYLGMIGSKRRVQIVKEQLKDEGFDQRALSKLHAPIGLDIGAETPEEIALSILAQVVQVMRQKILQSSHPKQSPSDILVLEKLAEEYNHSKAVVTIIAAKGSTPRGVGAKMIVWPNGKIFGSIGGGCSEGAVIHTALERMQKGGFEKVQVDLTDEAAEDQGMVCGGIMDVLIEADCVL